MPTSNFTDDEFKCNDGTVVPAVFKPNLEKLKKNLQVVRNFFGLPVTINSGFRTNSYNKKVGGSPKSQHLTASAADIVIKGKTPLEVRDAVEGLIRIGAVEEGGLGLYDTFVHYDVRGSRARWDERKP